jgi:alpha-tubulin suppressor-like RCC1 family protein
VIGYDRRVRRGALLGVCGWLTCSACLWKPELPAGDGSVPPSPYDEVAVGARHVCARSGSDVYCWGDNTLGQLGIQGAPLMVVSPRLVDAGHGWRALSAGADHTCAIDTAGVMMCWGDNSRGQVFGSANSTFPTPVTPRFSGTPPPFDDVSAGAVHTCAIGRGELWCWGEPNQIGPSSGTAIRIGTRTDWSEIRAGFIHTCGIAGTEVLCFGDNSQGEIGQPPSGNVTTPTAVPGLPAGVPLQLAAGIEASCAIIDVGNTGAGQLWCWGTNASGLLLTGGPSSLPPTRVGTDADWTDIELSYGVACGVRGQAAYCWGNERIGGFGDGVWQRYGVSVTDATSLGPAEAVELGVQSFFYPWNELGCRLHGNELACWGDAGEGELGLGTYTAHPAPTAVAAPPNEAWQHIWAGPFHTCGTTDQRLYCWGANDAGQIDGGIGFGGSGPPCTATECDVAVPAMAPIAGVAQQVVLGTGYSCARVGSDVTCWGDDRNGRLGTMQPGHSARQVPGTWAGLLGGRQGTCALTAGGQMSCWGVVAGMPYATPMDLTSQFVSPVDQIGLALDFACAHDTTGARTCWGGNSRGQLGNGTTTDVPPTLPIPADESGITTLAAIELHGCEARGGTSYCWGWNDDHQVSSAGGDQPTPVTVDTATGPLGAATAYALAERYSCALVAGTPYCWGINTDYQLGRGGPPDAMTFAAPVAVPAGKAWVELAVGDEHACALDSDHELYCWGRSSHGQFGDGSHAVNVPTPVGPRQ